VYEKQMTEKVQLSERAALARINRKLRAENRRLYKAKPGSLTERRHGRYYHVEGAEPGDPDGRLVMDSIDLADFARGVGALRHYEEVERLAPYPGMSLSRRAAK
jgi:hypothetical protein